MVGEEGPACEDEDGMRGGMFGGGGGTSQRMYGGCKISVVPIEERELLSASVTSGISYSVCSQESSRVNEESG